ncbi:MAG: SCO family protein [Streptosporangiaceae bacterium]|nr:SCO family protein [Streptosporangiaceae bacterium]
MLLRRVVVALAAVGLLAGCASSASTGGSGSGSSAAAMSNPNLDTGTSLGGAPAPEIRLTNQFGQSTSLSQLHGKVVLLGFEDSECTTVCPLTTQSMVWAKQLLGPAGDQVALLGVDANPDATKTSDVLSYSRTHGMLNEWNFLTGSLPQLKAVWSAYHIAVQVERGQIDHTPALFVIDQRGREQRLYLTQMAYSSVSQSAEVLADEVSSLLPGHPKVGSSQSLASIAGQGPGTSVTLPSALPGSAAAGSGAVALGPGKPRLVMFFATWLSETSDLRSELELGNAYAAWAARNGQPGLTGVDETVVEPSASYVRAYVGALGLRYPVGLDTTGRVADGYGVQDQPWFTLVSAAGKVLWTHDGWLSLPALQTAIQHPPHPPDPTRTPAPP